MQNQPQPQQPRQPSQIQISDNIPGGEYANAMQVSHNRDEFQMLFLNIFPPSGRVSAKVITTPGHVKRMVKALEENIKKYEGKFGEIREADLPHSEIGFAEKR